MSRAMSGMFPPSKRRPASTSGQFAHCMFRLSKVPFPLVALRSKSQCFLNFRASENWADRVKSTSPTRQQHDSLQIRFALDSPTMKKQPTLPCTRRIHSSDHE
jgi:hypothetical protein